MPEWKRTDGGSDSSAQDWQNAERKREGAWCGFAVAAVENAGDTVEGPGVFFECNRGYRKWTGQVDASYMATPVARAYAEQILAACDRADRGEFDLP